MNRDGERRLYVQMAPDEKGRQALARISHDLPIQSSGRRLPLEELHITLIHFGRVKDVLSALRTTIDVTDAVYERALETYIHNTAALMTSDSYHLDPMGYARFGARSATLVGTYKPSSVLVERHRLAYEQLILFIRACGITDAEDFAKHDQNFMFASTFAPHVTFYKGYDGPDPTDPLPPLDVTFMPLEY